MRKRIFALLLILSVFIRVSPSAYAHDVPQDRDDCSIEVLVRFNGENVDGGELTAIKIGYVAEEDGNYFFYQEMTDVHLDDIVSSDAPGIQKEFYENNKDNYDFYTQTQTVKDGVATFSGLPTGLYLIVQDNVAAGFSPMDPFLVSIPYLEEGEYRYHLTASVKSELEREQEEGPTKPKPDPSLPQTGQLNWPIPLMAVSGLALFTAGWLLCFGKKRELYEK